MRLHCLLKYKFNGIQYFKYGLKLQNIKVLSSSVMIFVMNMCSLISSFASIKVHKLGGSHQRVKVDFQSTSYVATEISSAMACRRMAEYGFAPP